MRSDREELVVRFTERLTPGAKMFGAVLAMELCDLTKSDPWAHATAGARGLEFGDVATLRKLCGEFGLDLSLASMSEESAEPRLRLQRVGPRSAQLPRFWRSKVAARIRAHLATRRIH